jgi:hypothetical protein
MKITEGAFSLAASKIEQIADEFAEPLEYDKFKCTPNFSFYALTLKDGTPEASNIIQLDEFPDIYGMPARKAAAWARENTGTPVEEIEKKINDALAEPE